MHSIIRCRWASALLFGMCVTAASAGGGGTIAGSVAELGLDRPLRGAGIDIRDGAGSSVATYITGVDGTWTSDPLPAGTYFAIATRSGFDAQLLAGLACPDATCDATAGTPIAVVDGGAVTGISFLLQRAGGAPAVPPILYINRCGGNCTILPGADNAITNRSSLVTSPRIVSAYAHGDAAFASVVRCIRATFSPYFATVVTDDPGNIAHRELVLAGTAPQIGQPNGVFGVAPWACGTPIPNAIAFAFANGMPSTALKDQCETATHEIGHLLGLDHESLALDTMSYDIVPDTLRRFVDAASPCGTSAASPQACYCGSAIPNQNSHQLVRAEVGVDRLFLGTFGDPDFPLPSGHDPARSMPFACGTVTTHATAR